MKPFNLTKGRMISGSKSRYSFYHPFRVPIYNANIVVQSGPRSELKKIWYGDLDLYTDYEQLLFLSQKFEKMYILRERDARFDSENRPEIKNAVLVFEKGVPFLSEGLKLIKNQAIIKNYYPLRSDRFSQRLTDITEISPIDLFIVEDKEVLLKQPMSRKSFLDENFNWCLANLDKIESGELDCYHKEVREFAIKDYLNEMNASFEFESEVLEVLSKNKKSKYFLRHFIKNRGKSKEHMSFLRKILYVDSYYISVSRKDSETIFQQSWERKYKNKKIELPRSDLRELKEFGEKYNLSSILELTEQFNHEKEKSVVDSVRKKDNIYNLLEKSFKEYYSVVERYLDDESFISLYKINEFYRDVINEAQSISFHRDCPEGKILIPKDRSIIF